jgi:hypothetical protein
MFSDFMLKLNFRNVLVDSYNIYCYTNKYTYRDLMQIVYVCIVGMS